MEALQTDFGSGAACRSHMQEMTLVSQLLANGTCMMHTYDDWYRQPRAADPQTAKDAPLCGFLRIKQFEHWWISQGQIQANQGEKPCSKSNVLKTREYPPWLDEFRVNMRCTQLLILHQGIKDLRVQLGAQVEQSHAGAGKKRAWHLHWESERCTAAENRQGCNA